MSTVIRYAYPYEKMTGIAADLYIYTENPIQLSEGEELPENSLQWKPQNTGGMRAYFDGFGWRGGPDLSEVSLDRFKKVIAKRKLHEFIEKVESLTSSYSDAEKQSWNQQISEAKAYLEMGSSNTPLLDVLAESRKIEKATLAQKILDKNNEYLAEYAKLLGEFQKERDMIEKAKKVEKLPLLTIEDLHYL